ncbi:hypothetical protein BC628DRAFT_829449 [Trametes gibbosa]|nr:hypothetical protein BC628DRAFT_829449 [Trametes gibbosa]
MVMGSRNAPQQDLLVLTATARPLMPTWWMRFQRPRPPPPASRDPSRRPAGSHAPRLGSVAQRPYVRCSRMGEAGRTRGRGPRHAAARMTRAIPPHAPCGGRASLLLPRRASSSPLRACVELRLLTRGWCGPLYSSGAAHPRPHALTLTHWPSIDRFIHLYSAVLCSLTIAARIVR